MKTVKTTQGHLAVIKSRNKAYEVGLDKFTKALCVTLETALWKEPKDIDAKEMQVVINRLTNMPILNTFCRHKIKLKLNVIVQIIL